ncbi:MAG: glycosyltransferase [Ruminococcus sp.]|nr:glycosyltransferase [Ruminococcus sp.]
MLISIVIPVFNSENFIRRCIESIQSQTYKNWECIIVDDGSTDSSLSLLQNYTHNDKRFRIIHQKNSGAGKARNNGIEQAKGDYIVFVDSDDVILPDYLEELSRHSEDVVFIDIDAVSEKGKIFRKENLSDYMNTPVNDIIRYQMTGTLPWGGWRKAVKLRILNEYKIRYSDDKNGEEAIYSFEVLLRAKSVGFIKKNVYRYILRDNSLSNSHNEDPWGGLIKSYCNNELVKNDIEKGGFFNTLNSLNLCATAISLDRLSKYYKFKDYCIKARMRINKCKESLMPEYGFDYEHLDLKSKIACKIIEKGNYRLFYVLSKLKSQIDKLITTQS